MKKKRLWLFISLIFLFSFALFTYLVKEDFFNKFDFDSMVLLQDNLPKKYDAFLSSFSLIGSFEVLAGFLALLAIFRKKFRAFLIFIPLAAAHVIEIIGKYFVHHPGPPHLFFRYNIEFLFPSSYVQPGSSYPSGHSLRVVFVSVIISYLINRSKKISQYNKLIFNFLLFFFNGLMLVSRISLGEHWTTDVIGGVLLGLSSGLFALIFL